MKIVLSGVETNNKGAELMLYAILQEIERRWPEAEVYIPFKRVKQGLSYVKSKVKLSYTPLSRIFFKLHIGGILRRLHLPNGIYARTFIVRNADLFIDGSGFAFGDQWNLSEDCIKLWGEMLRPLHENGCKIVFLPQAFGPVEKNSTKKALSVINRYAEIIMPREQVSFDYLKKSGVIDMGKVRKFTDFTSLVEGIFPVGYERLKEGICIIPNMKMIDKGGLSFDGYIKLLSGIAEEGRKSGRPVYLLNHEGPKDAALCLRCKESLSGEVEAVTSLNALEVKGLIASAYLVITSRFHGLASSLNSGVPSLATSWSHKYEELFKDYGLDGRYILPLNDFDGAMSKVRVLLKSQENKRVRSIIESKVPEIKRQTREMWNVVWKR